MGWSAATILKGDGTVIQRTRLLGVLCLGFGRAVSIACSPSTPEASQAPTLTEGATIATTEIPVPVTEPAQIAKELAPTLSLPVVTGATQQPKDVDVDSLLAAAANVLEPLSAAADAPSRSIVYFLRDIDVVARAMADSGDSSYLPVLVKLQRMELYFSGRSTIGPYLTRLSGEEENIASAGETDPNWWAEWLGNHREVRPPQGYAAWMGRLLSHIDPGMGAFFYDGVKTRIRLEEVVWGGVPKDGIPDLINPPVVSPEQAAYLNPTDRVFGVSINGEHRAYPLRILNPHEMANDVLGGVPFALAY